jgi:hypothetical protein
MPPVANAGADLQITLPNNSVLLSGSATDADGTILAYKWTKIAGPSPSNIVSATSAATVIERLVKGTYLIELMVTDNLGASGRDTVVIIVNKAINVPPHADAGPDRVISLPADSLHLAGSGLDSDGSVESYKWKKLEGPAGFNTSDASDPRSWLTKLTEGTYTFELTVTDDDGAKAKDLVSITVKKVPSSSASVYPNPTTGVVNLQILANTHQNMTTLIVYDEMGRPIINEVFMRSQTSMTKQIDLSRFPKGVYLIEVAADINTKVTCKVVKQ